MNKALVVQNIANRAWFRAFCGLCLLLPLAARAAAVVRDYPAPPSSDCAPLMIISPGAGGSEQGLAYLAEAVQQAGWRAVVVNHPSTGPKVLAALSLKNGLRPALVSLLASPSVQQARQADIANALHWAKQGCLPPYSVLAGHSLGAATVMLQAGANNLAGLHGADAFNAYIALSPQGVGSLFPVNAWAALQKPILSITGTEDQAAEGPISSRLEAFENMPPGCKWLAVISGATHAQLAGIGAWGQTRALVLATTLKFLDAARANPDDCPPPAALPQLQLRSK